MRHLENGKMVLLPNAFINRQNRCIKTVLLIIGSNVYRFGTHINLMPFQVAPSNTCAQCFSDLQRFGIVLVPIGDGYKQQLI